MPAKFKYVEQESDIFGKVKRPLIKIEIFSFIKNVWVPVYKVLTDTGADISILPKFIGELVVKDVASGRFYSIKGVVPYSFLSCYIHNLKLRINSKEFELPVAIADSDNVPVVLGRVGGLDRFISTFIKGEEIVIE